MMIDYYFSIDDDVISCTGVLSDMSSVIASRFFRQTSLPFQDHPNYIAAFVYSIQAVELFERINVDNVESYEQ